MNTAIIGAAIAGAGFLLVATGCVTDTPWEQSHGGYPQGQVTYPQSQATYPQSQATYPPGSYTQTQSQSPRLVCRDVVVTQNNSRDKHRIIGTAAGAALGGLVGNQFGGGDANKVITAAGVVAGGYAGNTGTGRNSEGQYHDYH